MSKKKEKNVLQLVPGLSPLSFALHKKPDRPCTVVRLWVVQVSFSAF